MVVEVGLPSTSVYAGLYTRRNNKGLTPRLQNKWVDYHFLSIQDPTHTHPPIAPGRVPAPGATHRHRRFYLTWHSIKRLGNLHTGDFNK